MKRLGLLLLAIFFTLASPAIHAATTTYVFEGLGEKGTVARGSFQVDSADIPDVSSGSFSALTTQITAFGLTLTNIPATPSSKTYTLAQFGDIALAKSGEDFALFTVHTSNASNTFTYWVWSDGYPYESSGIYRISTSATYEDNERLDTIHWAKPTASGHTRNQLILPPSIGPVPLNAPPFSVTASASSGLPVTIEVTSGPATITGGVITLTGEAGLVVLSLTQAGGVAGSDVYNAASTEMSFEVGEAVELTTQTITFPVISNLQSSSPPVLLKPTASSGLPVTLTVVSGPASISGGLLSLSGAAGQVTVRATQAGGLKNGVYYGAAAPVERSFEVLAAPPTMAQSITFAQPAPAVYGDPSRSLTATSSSGLPVSFQVVSGPGSLVNSTLSFTGAGSVVVRALQPGDATFKPAASVTRTIVVAKAPLTVTFANAGRLVGGPNPVFVPQFSGFVGTDTEDDIDVLPVGVTTASAKSAQGSYLISFRGGLDNNYRFTAGAPSYLTVRGFGGTFESLVVDESSVPRGKLTLTVPSNALTYTGTLDLASEPAPLAIRGTLEVDGVDLALGTWTRVSTGLPSLGVEFEISGDSLSNIVVTRAGSIFAESSPAHPGSRIYLQAVSGKTKVPAPWTGTYTLIARAPQAAIEGDSREIPGGASYASANVAASGLMSLKGRLADGTVLTAAVRAAKPLSDDATATGNFPLWVRPYSKRTDSFVSGSINLVTHPDQARFPQKFYQAEEGGALFWAKAASYADSVASAGFVAELEAPVDPWLAPVTRVSTAQPSIVTLAQRLGLTDSSAIASLFASFVDLDPQVFGARSAQVPTTLNLQITGALTLPPTSAPAPANPTSFTVKVVPATGTYEGSFVLSDLVAPSTKPIVRKVSVQGSFRQGPAGAPVAYGTILVPVLGSTVRQSFELQLSETN